MAFVALLPVMAVIGLAVKLSSPGPAIHRRRVMERGGAQFDAFKFRTTYVNGDEILAQHPELLAQLKRDHKLKNDPRVTRMGKFLRRTSLDELAQLMNVALGQMSLVGPRMISPAEAEMYGRMKNNLLTVKPGLTGLWAALANDASSAHNAAVCPIALATLPFIPFLSITMSTNLPLQIRRYKVIR